MMRILVTGGAGFIGSHLTDALVERGHRVTVFDNLDPQVHPNGTPPAYLNANAHFIKGDIRDPQALGEAVRSAEVIFHKACAVGVAQSQYEIAKYVSVNTFGTANLLDILVNTKHGVKKLILAASMSSYGEGLYRCTECGPVRPSLRSSSQMARQDWQPRCPFCENSVVPVPTPEEAELHSISIYAISKKDQEEMCLLIGKTYGIPVVSLRYFNVYGPRQSLSNPYNGVAAIFMSRIKNNRPPIIFEDGLQTRDFISVGDLVQVNLGVMDTHKADNQILNVGSGRAIPIRDVAEVLARACGKDVAPEITKTFRKGDVRHCFADNTKLKTILGYTPETSFERGIRDLLEWSGTVEAEDLFDKFRAELEAKGLASS